MKKNIILFVLCVYSLTIFSQTGAISWEPFVLQLNGKFLTQDKKDYVVIEYTGKTKQELYNDYLATITKIYFQSKDGIDKVDNEIIKVYGLNESAFSINFEKKLLGIPAISTYQVKYVLQFQFKDGKIRIDAPVFLTIRNNSLKHLGTSPQSFPTWLDKGKYFYNVSPEITGKKKKDDENIEKANRENKVKANAINAINDYANGLINSIVNYGSVYKEESDW